MLLRMSTLFYTISLPESANNDFQGKTASLSRTFPGPQPPGTAR